MNLILSIPHTPSLTLTSTLPPMEMSSLSSTGMMIVSMNGSKISWSEISSIHFEDTSLDLREMKNNDHGSSTSTSRNSRSVSMNSISSASFFIDDEDEDEESYHDPFENTSSIRSTLLPEDQAFLKDLAITHTFIPLTRHRQRQYRNHSSTPLCRNWPTQEKLYSQHLVDRAMTVTDYRVHKMRTKGFTSDTIKTTQFWEFYF